jgi:hypothetical protein
MSLLTFQNLMDSEVPGTVGVCPTSDAFLSYTNKATRMLINRGDFFGTVERIKLCVYNSCLVWPRFVGTVQAVNICGRATEVFNNWYQFMPLSRQDFCSGGFGFNGNSCTGNLTTINDGTSPVFNPIVCGQPRYIRAYPSTQQDVGKKTRIFGVNEGGQTVRTQNADLTWTDGIELTLAIPFASTSMKFREITRITKEETQGVVRYYQWDDAALAGADLTDLVFLEPTEISPMFRKSKVPTRCSAGSCSGLTSVEALVKLEFIPVKYPTDLVLISNLDALSDAMLAVKYSNGGDKDMAKDFEAKAIREMNLELNNKFPNEQTPIFINPFGSALPANHCIGQII